LKFTFVLSLKGYAVIQIPEMALYLYVWAKKFVLARCSFTPNSVDASNSSTLQKRNASKEPRNIDDDVPSATKFAWIAENLQHQKMEYENTQKMLNAISERMDKFDINFRRNNIELKKIAEHFKIRGYTEV
jgi:hypothetical protein